jgi:hypothetical protein
MAQRSPSLHSTSAAQTLLFVDVDGVLNVGIGDPGNAPIEFNSTNVERAAAMWSKRSDLPTEIQTCLERIAATRTRELRFDEDGTYEKFESSPHNNLSDVLVGRLAKLVIAAGESCTVVLSSTWRLPRHERRVELLEQAISRHLGRVFTFSARTDVCEDRTPQGRLECIGDFVEQHCRSAEGPAGKLRLLVLEDFHLTPMGSWAHGETRMKKAEDVERYLCSRAPDSVEVSAKLIHTFDEWQTESGLKMNVGCGITQAHFREALTFLDGRKNQPKCAPVLQEAPAISRWSFLPRARRAPVVVSF